MYSSECASRRFLKFKRFLNNGIMTNTRTHFVATGDAMNTCYVMFDHLVNKEQVSPECYKLSIENHCTVAVIFQQREGFLFLCFQSFSTDQYWSNTKRKKIFITLASKTKFHIYSGKRKHMNLLQLVIKCALDEFNKDMKYSNCYSIS